ncbi:MAG TPA: hypothetical protein VNZ57_15115, partial [Longimicrobiales bacterium]|nr:hypothetical protein [Longimicrobiales bacterium]
MNDAVAKVDLFRRLGYGGAFDLLEEVLEEAGLSRRTRPNISTAKVEAVRAVLAEHFVIVCGRGDCQAEISELGDDRLPVPASSRDECAVCGGSANARAVDELVSAMKRAGYSRLCVVGGSPNARSELERLVAGRIELRLVDGAIARAVQQAQADLAWADRVALWGGTILAHKVSRLYDGP